MWASSPQATFRYSTSSGGFGELKQPEEAHAHTPGKSMASITNSRTGNGAMVYNNAWASNRAFPVPASQWQPHPYQCESRWSFGIYADHNPGASLAESGVEALRAAEAVAWQHRGARSSCEDVPMPDYTSSSSSRAISSMTGISYEHSKQPSITAPMDDDQYNLLIQALTPTKAPTIGTRAPSNTPSAIAPLAKSAPAKEARLPSNTRISNRKSALREISQASTRNVSESTNKSNPNLIEKDISTPPKMGTSPSSHIKSKKEGTKEMPKENQIGPPEEEFEYHSEKEDETVPVSAI